MVTNQSNYDKMDLVDVLADAINNNVALPLPLRIGFLEEAESLQLLTLPSSQVIEQYFDGSKDMLMNYALNYKTTDAQGAAETLFKIVSYLDTLETLESPNDTFEFQDLTVASMPFLSDQNERYLTYSADFQVTITI